MVFVFQGSLRNALFYKGLQLQEYGAERFRLIQDILLSRVHLAAVRPDLIDEINTKDVSVILGGSVRNPDFAKDHIDVEVKAGKVITAIKAQSIHDKPGDPGAQLIFQFYEFFLIYLILPPVKNPVKIHLTSLN
jgi:hypothetical protein